MERIGRPSKDDMLDFIQRKAPDDCRDDVAVALTIDLIS